jgi:hypothetical protein
MSHPNNVLAAEAKQAKHDRLAAQLANRPLFTGARVLRHALGFPKNVNVFG